MGQDKVALNHSSSLLASPLSPSMDLLNLWLENSLRMPRIIWSYRKGIPLGRRKELERTHFCLPQTKALALAQLSQELVLHVMDLFWWLLLEEWGSFTGCRHWYQLKYHRTLPVQIYIPPLDLPRYIFAHIDQEFWKLLHACYQLRYLQTWSTWGRVAYKIVNLGNLLWFVPPH